MLDTRHRIRFPAQNSAALQQNEAYFELECDQQLERIHFHDYQRIYSIPGLYEQLFYDRLRCDSPRKLADILHRVVSEARENIHHLRVLDLGAGNGMMGEALKHYGVARLVGLDILPAAFDACQRDRPGVYDGYYVEDLTRLSPAQREQIQSWQFDALTTVAALGFDDIPPSVFVNAFNLVGNDGWICFNIKERFLKGEDQSGFSRLIRNLILSDVFDLCHMERYRHRLSIEGAALYYFAVAGRKRGAIGSGLLD